MHAGAGLGDVEAVAGLKAHECDVSPQRRPAAGPVGGRVEADEHRQPELDQRRLPLDAAGWRVSFVVGAKRVEHARGTAICALDDAEKLDWLGDVSGEQVAVGDAHEAVRSIALEASARKACSTHSVSCSLGA